MLEESDMETLSYRWDTVKLSRIGRKLKDTDSSEWPPKRRAAADLALWCLQARPERRPQSMLQVLQHRFFSDDGELRFLEPSDETWDGFVQRQASDLHSAVENRDSVKVKNMLSCGGAHIRMIDRGRAGSTAEALHRAAFANDTKIMGTLLGEVLDIWPDHIKAEYLDCKTKLGYTPYMIACECGFTDIAQMLEQRGCNTEIKNDAGKTGLKLAAEFAHNHGQAAVKMFERGDQLHLTTPTLEEYIAMMQRALNKDVRAGIRLWSSKLVVFNYSKEGMRALEAKAQQLTQYGFSIALHFTDLGSTRLILNGLGIRASSAGQLGGGVSVCLRSLVDFDWGQGWDKFCEAVGKALWGR